MVLSLVLVLHVFSRYEPYLIHSIVCLVVVIYFLIGGATVLFSHPVPSVRTSHINATRLPPSHKSDSDTLSDL